MERKKKTERQGPKNVFGNRLLENKSSSHKPAHNLTCLQPEVSLLWLAKRKNAYLMHFSESEALSIIYTLSGL